MSDVLTVRQAAEYLQIDPQTVSRKLQHGLLPGQKIGRIYRIRKEDLDEYLKGSFKPQKGPAKHELSAQELLINEVRRQAESEIPRPTPKDAPNTDTAINRALAALGYEGKEEQFWIDVAPLPPDHELLQRYRAAVAALPDEDRELIRHADEVHAINRRVTAIWAHRVHERVKELLAEKGYKLAGQPWHVNGVEVKVIPDNPDAYAIGEGLLIPLSETEKEELESATAGRPARSRAK